MAVKSPIHALLSAHLQATWNRSLKELSKTGTLALVLAITLVGLLLAIPVLGGGITLGYFLGRYMEDQSFALLLSGVLIFLVFLGGVVGGILGGSRVLAWESTRVFPLRLRSLFTAELVAGLGDLLPMVTAVLSVALMLGLGLARPSTLPLLPFVWVGTIASQLCLQHLFGSLAARLVKRLQVGLLVLGIAFWFSSMLMPILTKRLALERKATPATQAETLRHIGETAEQVLKVLPPTQAALGLSDAIQGRWGTALGRQLYPMAFLALLLFLAARVMKRDSEPQTLRIQRRGKGAERLWSFSSPMWGVARLHWHTLISSHLGKFGFLMPLLTIVLIKGPLSAIKGVQSWSLPVGFAYLAMTGTQMQLNQFGMDGAGVKALFLLPLRARDLLQGKFWGLAMFQGIQAALLLLLLSLGGGLSPLRMAAALCMAACLFLVQTGLGHWTSAWMPRPMPRNSLKNTNQSPAVVWLGLATSICSAFCFGGIYLLVGWLAPALLLPVMALLLGLVTLLYRRKILPATAHYLDKRRENLVQVLG